MRFSCFINIEIRERTVFFGIMSTPPKWFLLCFQTQLFNDINEPIYETETIHRQREQGKGGGGGRDWEVGISRGKLLYTEQINNKVLLYSTRDHIHYSVINYNGKEYENECLYIWINESLRCIAETNNTVNQLYFNKRNFKNK